ncbi:MAG: PAS domain S-box protein [Methanomassiliicoccales archaeon]|jgi:PAS domain S-box-containing protein
MFRVLYIDDERTLWDVCRESLEKSGDLALDAVGSIIEAKEAMKHTEYDATISEHHMPGTDGIGFLKELREMGNRIPFILFTGRGREDVVIEALNSGANFYVLKSGDELVQFTELKHKVMMAIERNAADNKLIVTNMDLEEALYIGHLGNWCLNLQTGNFIGNDRTWALHGTNAVAEKGYELSIARYVEEMIHPDDRELFLKEFARIGGPDPRVDFGSIEYRIMRRDGDTRDVFTNYAVVRNAKGRPLKAHGILLDITEQKKAEEALRRQTVMHSILSDIIMTANRAEDLPHLISDVLEASLRLMDFESGGIYLVDRPMRMAELVHSMNFPQVFLSEIQAVPIDVTPFDTVFIRGEELVTEHMADIVTENSKRFGFQSMISVPLLTKGDIIGSLIVASKKRVEFKEDEKRELVSIGKELGNSINRMLAETEVKRSAKNFETLFDSISDMLFVMGIDGRILRVNNAVNEQLMYSPEEIMRMNVIELHPPEWREAAKRKLSEVVAGETKFHELPYLSKDGRTIQSETVATLGWWNNQDVIIGLSRDVTERVRIEKALRIANNKLGILNNITRHDINNQLLALVGYLELCRLRENDPVLSQYMSKMAKVTEGIQEQIVFMKEYQDIGAKEPSWMSIDRQISSAFAFLDHEGITLENDTKDIEILADPLVEKVPYNLIDDSIRHGEHVTRIMVRAEEKDGALLLTYEDDGVGISDGSKEHVFEKGVGRNTGFGLFFCREILSITGITIKESGTMGKGVRFEMLVQPGFWRRSTPNS